MESVFDYIFEEILSEWHECQGCKSHFKADSLFKGDDGKFYCDDCLKVIEDDKKEG